MKYILIGLFPVFLYGKNLNLCGFNNLENPNSVCVLQFHKYKSKFCRPGEYIQSFSSNSEIDPENVLMCNNPKNLIKYGVPQPEDKD